MVEQTSGFRGVIDFLGKIGVYEVVLPFLLVFTLVFAILEKTKILGTEKIDGKEYTKKNLNAMISFVMAFFVIASAQLVRVINEVLANVVLLLVLAVCFLLLVGVFFGSKEFTLEQYPGWIKFFMVLMFIAIVVIFLNSLDWLRYIFALFVYWNTEWAATILFFLVIIGFMVYVTHDSTPKKEAKKD